MPPLKKQSTNESFAVIREEQSSPAESVGHIRDIPQIEVENLVNSYMQGKDPSSVNLATVMDIVAKTEETLRIEFQHVLTKETAALKERFEEILQNEEVRASFMMCEAHRERQEKISALQTQLECKNLASLMYVLCLERKKSKVEKLKIIEEYNTYIQNLHSILRDSQEIILNLSRGYKTAARVDHEWRMKVRKILKQFQHFVYNYMGGSPEVNQYFFNIPETLKTETSTTDDMTEDPIDYSNTTVVNTDLKSDAWWDTLEDDDRPFVMFGDLSHLDHGEKKEASKKAMAEKTAPAYWKDYIFNGITLNVECPNASKIKDKYLERIPVDKWECHTQNEVSTPPMNEGRRGTIRQSVDFRANMGSILKLITATGQVQPAKTMLLGARDSMEIASTTKMRERRRQSVLSNRGDKGDDGAETSHNDDNLQQIDNIKLERHEDTESTEGRVDHSQSLLGSIHNDSLQVIHSHKPDVDHKINYEKVCPVEKCRRLKVNSFIRTLPEYMRANPFEIFDVTLDGYETCTKEQLQVLRERIERKHRKSVEQVSIPVNEWEDIGVTVATQTSEVDPCECNDNLDEVLSGNIAYRIEELLPTRQALDEIQQKCFFDPAIQFDRFRVIGQDSDTSFCLEDAKKDFKTARIEEITAILRKHPSLCDMFQANTTSS